MVAEETPIGRTGLPPDDPEEGFICLGYICVYCGEFATERGLNQSGAGVWWSPSGRGQCRNPETWARRPHPGPHGHTFQFVYGRVDPKYPQSWDTLKRGWQRWPYPETRAVVTCESCDQKWERAPESECRHHPNPTGYIPLPPSPVVPRPVRRWWRRRKQVV